MLRAQAIALLKELVTNGLIDTAWVSIEERKTRGFELRVKGNCDESLINQFLEKRNLKLEENTNKGWLAIY